MDAPRSHVADVRSTVSWVSPAADLWVASRRDVDGTHFLGFIESRGGVFVAMDGRGRSLGSYATLATAKGAFEPPPAPAAGAGIASTQMPQNWRDAGARVVMLRHPD